MVVFTFTPVHGWYFLIGALQITSRVSENRGFLSLANTNPKKLSFNDTVAIPLVIKYSTLLGFVKKSATLTLPFDRIIFSDRLTLWKSKATAAKIYHLNGTLIVFK